MRLLWLALVVLLIAGPVSAHEEHHHHHQYQNGWWVPWDYRLYEPQRYWYCNPHGYCWWRWRE